MTSIAYGMKHRTNLDMAAAEAAVRDALATEGFGVLTEIDLASTLREKLGVERPPYRILGACNPVLANQAVGVEPDAGLLLPCNVAIYEDGDGVVIALLEPVTMVEVADNPGLADMAKEASARLERVVAALP